MSANVCWEPVEVEPDTLHTMAPQSFIKQMAEAGMELPMTFDKDHLPLIRAMKAAANEATRTPLSQLETAILRHGSIRTWVRP